jgi:hypothetical protein
MDLVPPSPAAARARLLPIFCPRSIGVVGPCPGSEANATLDTADKLVGSEGLRRLLLLEGFEVGIRILETLARA